MRAFSNARKVFLFLMTCSVILLTACNGSGLTSQSTSSASSKVYGIDETAPITRNGEQVGTVKINSVKKSSNLDIFTDKPSEAVVVNYTYENSSDDTGFPLSFAYFRAADSSGSITQPILNGLNKNPQNIPKGTNCTAEMAIGFSHDGNSFTLYCYDIGDPTKLVSTFKLSIK